MKLQERILSAESNLKVYDEAWAESLNFPMFPAYSIAVLQRIRLGVSPPEQQWQLKKKNVTYEKQVESELFLVCVI